jgi:hypothetical protein
VVRRDDKVWRFQKQRPHVDKQTFTSVTASKPRPSKQKTRAPKRPRRWRAIA